MRRRLWVAGCAGVILILGLIMAVARPGQEDRDAGPVTAARAATEMSAERIVASERADCPPIEAEPVPPGAEDDPVHTTSEGEGQVDQCGRFRGFVAVAGSDPSLYPTLRVGRSHPAQAKPVTLDGDLTGYVVDRVGFAEVDTVNDPDAIEALIEAHWELSARAMATAPSEVREALPQG